MRQLWLDLGAPVVAIAAFLLCGARCRRASRRVSGRFPGPRGVEADQGACGPITSCSAKRPRRSTSGRRNATREAGRRSDRGHDGAQVHRQATYIDQIFTSLKTVFAGFLLATLFAVPIGILCGASKTFNAMFNPLIQLFKPVSPLAWLPIVTMIVSAVYVTADPLFDKSFINSAVTVTLVFVVADGHQHGGGRGSIDRDLLNVARVLRLKKTTQLTKLVLPFGVAVHLHRHAPVARGGLDGADRRGMLAQNPGLGKFVWDEFQNGSSESLSRSWWRCSPSASSASCSTA
jgi:nitrate/nitrite transport system permease protein